MSSLFLDGTVLIPIHDYSDLLFHLFGDDYKYGMISIIYDFNLWIHLV